MATNEVERILDKLNNLSEKIDDIQAQRYQNGIKLTQVEGRVNAVEDYILEDKQNRRDELRHRRQMNWKLWFLIISGAIGILFLLIKDSLI